MFGGEPPGHGLVDDTIVRPVSGHVFEIVDESPDAALADEVDRRGGQYRIVLVYELRERVVEITRPALEHDVRVADLLGERRVIEDRHDAFPNDAAKQIVQIFDRRRAPARFALLDRVSRR